MGSGNDPVGKLKIKLIFVAIGVPYLVIIKRFPWHRGIQKHDEVAKVTRNKATVSLQLFYDAGDQQETALCCLCCLLATVKNI